MSKFLEFIHYTDSGTLITVLFDRAGNVVAANYADKSFPINLDMTEQLKKLQGTPFAQLSWSENRVRLNLQEWFKQAEKNSFNDDDFDKEGA